VAVEDAYGRCEALVRANDRDRFLAGLFAPQPARAHLYALYAFAGEIARVREAAREPMPGELRLQWWRDALAGSPEAGGHPVVGALRHTVAACRLPQEPLIALIDARAFDLYDEPMASLSDLEAYLRATEGTPFALAAAILGDDAAAGASAAGAAADAAGIAYGLAQVLRAFPHTRSLVPEDVLMRHGIGRAAIDAAESAPGLAAALAMLRGQAREAYQRFRDAAQSLPEHLAPAFLAAVLAPLWLDRLERRADPLAPVDVPQWWRQWRLWRAARRWPKI
jgi:15-cis-phytoene synthase